MGSASSKAVRKYPKRASGGAPGAPGGTPLAQRTRPPPRPSQPAVKPSSPSDAGKVSYVKDDAIRADGVDPDMPGAAFSDRLRQMGIVQPSPTFSPSSIARRGPFPAEVGSASGPAAIPGATRATQTRRTAQNETLAVLEARRQLQDLASEEEAGGWAMPIRGKGKGSGNGNGSGSGGNISPPSSSASAIVGREFLAARTIRDILVLQKRGFDAAAIEARLRLKSGVVARLGPQGMVEAL